VVVQKWVRLVYFHILNSAISAILAQFCGFWPIEIGFVLFSYQKSNLKNQNCGIACGDEFSISDRVVKEPQKIDDLRFSMDD